MKQKKEIFKAMREFFHKNKDKLDSLLIILTFITCLILSGVSIFKLTKPVSYTQQEITMYTNVAKKIREEGINSLDQSDINSIKYIDISFSENKISIQKKTHSIGDAYILRFIGSDLVMHVDEISLWAGCIALTIVFSLLLAFVLSFLVSCIVIPIISEILSLIIHFISFCRNYNKEP